MTDPERIREACNAENNPELPEGCMHPWCLCNRYPEGSMTRIETPDKDISLLREALEAEIDRFMCDERTSYPDHEVLEAFDRLRAAFSATAPKP